MFRHISLWFWWPMILSIITYTCSYIFFCKSCSNDFPIIYACAHLNFFIRLFVFLLFNLRFLYICLRSNLLRDSIIFLMPEPYVFCISNIIYIRLLSFLPWSSLPIIYCIVNFISPFKELTFGLVDLLYCMFFISLISTHIVIISFLLLHLSQFSLQPK